MIPLAQTILARSGAEQARTGDGGRRHPGDARSRVGPVLGGVIVTDLSWRVMFYINVPVCLAAVAAAYRVAMPGNRGR